MKIFFGFLLYFFFSLFSHPSLASDDGIAILGNGSCRDLLQEGQSYQRGQQLYSWATGFFTGQNVVLITEVAFYRDLTGVTEELVIRKIYERCAGNPDMLVPIVLQGVFVTFPLRKVP